MRTHPPTLILPFRPDINTHTHTQGIEALTKYIVDFDSFLKILNRPNGFREPGEPEEFVRGFQVFDKEMTGFVGVGELKYGVFTSWFFFPLLSSCLFLSLFMTRS